MSINNKAYSISRFCENHNISRGMFYLLTERNEAPKTMRVGRRVLISDEAATEWRKRMEESSNSGEKLK